MDLVKWLRKNNKKVMAVVVILIMIAFVMPSVLQQLSSPALRAKKPIAYFGKDGKITSQDIMTANQQLNTLRAVQMDKFLSLSADLRVKLLGQLLFPDPAISVRVYDQIKKTVLAGRLQADLNLIDKFFEKSRGKNEFFWLLLKAEAKQAGCVFSVEQAQAALESLLPQLNPEYKPAQFLQMVVSSSGVSEEMIFSTVADMLSIVSYAHITTSTEDTTIPQIMNSFAREKESIKAELVKIDASLFTAKIPQPTEDQITAQFDNFKQYEPKQIDEQNPCGFGYKQPDRIQLEYMILTLDDVAASVSRPTSEETEDYYHSHPADFTARVPLDPNDPNSQLIEKKRTYAEAAPAIKQFLLRQRISTKAELILNEAKALTETALEKIDVEQLDGNKLKQLAGDYSAAAKTVAAKHNIKVYSGQTSLLSATDIAADTHLGKLYVLGQSLMPVSLVRAAFAISDINSSILGPFDIPKPKLYENIGPMKTFDNQIAALVRITASQKTFVPENVNFSLDLKSVKIDENTETPAKTYSIRETVISDYKTLQAMSITKEKADEFIKIAGQKGWEKTCEQFADLYKAPQAESEPNIKSFELLNWPELKRIPTQSIVASMLQVPYNPAAKNFVYDTIIYKNLIDTLYSFIPTEHECDPNLPKSFAFMPDTCCYAVKTLCVSRASQDEYEAAKGQSAFIEDFVRSQSWALIHFDPENIFQRMNFKWAEETQPQPSDANSPHEQNESLQ